MKNMAKKSYQKPELKKHEIDMGVYGDYNVNPGAVDDRKDPFRGGDWPDHTEQ